MWLCRKGNMRWQHLPGRPVGERVPPGHQPALPEWPAADPGALAKPEPAPTGTETLPLTFHVVPSVSRVYLPMASNQMSITD